MSIEGFGKKSRNFLAIQDWHRGREVDLDNSILQNVARQRSPQVEPNSGTRQSSKLVIFKSLRRTESAWKTLTRTQSRQKRIHSPRTSLPVSTRQFGTSLRSSPAARLAASRSPLSSTRISAGVAFGASSQPFLASRLQARYASTGAEASPAAAAAAAPVTGAELPGLTGGDLATPVTLSGSDLLNMPETIGFLKSFGLDYGWGVTSLMQWYVEHIYVWTGMPWWATIGVAALGLRLAIFKPSLDALVQQQKLNDLRKHPRFSQLESDFKVKMATGQGFAEGAHIQQEMTMIRKSQGIKIWKTLVPMINIPISFGMFRTFRGMASLPVPSLETGGVLWFPDLAQADPFFILPALTAVVVWRGMTVCLVDAIYDPRPYLLTAHSVTDCYAIHGPLSAENNEDGIYGCPTTLAHIHRQPVSRHPALLPNFRWPSHLAVVGVLPAMVPRHLRPRSSSGTRSFARSQFEHRRLAAAQRSGY